ncbi:dihydroorotase [Rhizobium tubonense]|uniref:Dihydroorotase n=1 Tax=Rhizobium tubonense TaxID=484088 RepID=A0A2W4CX36_9HYPH|nr:dihydroorotase family protein [Rhizobium tubonense]PZM14775.1 dihydroorotase [Rhizobium tubonense]
MFDLIISGGTVVNAEGERRADVAIVDGHIAALLSPGEPGIARDMIDASNKYLMPGLVDAHAHLREPGLTHKEDFESGTRAAALGGVTTVLDMPTDDPWTATPQQLSAKMALAMDRIHVDVGFQVVLNRDLSEIDALEELGPVSFELFTADVPENFLFPTIDAASQALGRFASRNTLVGVSPGDQSILMGSADRETVGDVAAFLASRPPLAEANGIARALLAAASTKTRIHVRQINSALGIATWRRLRDLADATVETTPQNLFFTAEDCQAQGANLKGSPPFRAKHDVEMLRAAMREGLIDIVGTDHAPHSPAEKSASYPAFADIPGGMPGLQTLLQLMLKLVGEEVIGLSDLVRMCAFNPAARFGLGNSKGAIAPGYDADMLIVDRRRTSRISNTEQVSRAGYTPFDGWEVTGQLDRVFLRGREIVRDGKLSGGPSGLVVRRGA